MTLLEKLSEDLKASMKAGKKERVEVLRFVISGVKGAEKEKQAKTPDAKLTDEEIIVVVQKDAKRRKEAVEMFRQGNRADLVEKEEADLAIIYEYIPKELSTSELEKMVDDAKAGGANDFNSLMKEVMKMAKGRADGKAVGEIIKKKLG